MFFVLAEMVVPGSERVVASGPILYLVGIAATALFAAATWAVLELRKKLAAQTEQTWKATLFSELGLFAETVVHELEATLRTELGKASADGSLTAGEIVGIQGAALRKMKALLTETGVAKLRKAFGWSEEAVDSQLRGVLEKKVAESKVASAIAANPTLSAVASAASSFSGK